MVKALTKAGIKGEKIVLETIDPNRLQIISNTYWNIAKYWHHEAVKIGDTVYDNVFKNGIRYSDWLNDLGYNTTQFKKVMSTSF